MIDTMALDGSTVLCTQVCIYIMMKGRLGRPFYRILISIPRNL